MSPANLVSWAVDVSGASYAMFGYRTPNQASSRLLPARVRVLTRMWTASPHLIQCVSRSRINDRQLGARTGAWCLPRG